MEDVARSLSFAHYDRALIQAEFQARATTKFLAWFPDCDQRCQPDSRRRADHVGFCRVLYPKQMEAIAASATNREVAVAGGNRVGKSEMGGYIMTADLTGLYPPWWTGRKFDGPIDAWAAGTSAKTTRNIIQNKLLGPIHDLGTGMIPRHLIVSTSAKQGIPNGIETIKVKHVSGGISTLDMLSYDQGRSAFEGTSRHRIWLDEEPPDDVYEECFLRTMDCDGMILLTFTPLQGLTPLVMQFLPPSGLEGLSSGGHNASAE